jgi:cell division septation protein DedD
MSSPELINEDKIQEPLPVDINENQYPPEDITENPQEENNQVEQFDSENSNIPEKNNLDEDLTNDENTAPEISDEELNTNADKAFEYSPIYSEEDENVQEYYTRKEKFYNHNDKHSPLKIVMWIVIPIILMVPPGYYYYTNYISSNILENDELQQSQLPHSISDVAPTDIIAMKAQAGNEKKINNVMSSRTENTETSRSGQITNANDSRSIIDTPNSGNAPIGQNKIYSLILGSFREKDNANKLVRRLQRQGKEVEIFQRGNSLHFVGFENIEGNSNAVKLLKEIKLKESDAWIIKKWTL